MRLISGNILQILFDSCYHYLPEFEYKSELLKLFGNKYLRERVKIDQDRIDNKFDISLVDTEFLDYDKNDAFVYFWNIPSCVFSMIVPLIKVPAYSYYIIRGISLSAGGITLNTHEKAVFSLIQLTELIDKDDLSSSLMIL